jgi:hypothetical protein
MNINFGPEEQIIVDKIKSIFKKAVQKSGLPREKIGKFEAELIAFDFQDLAAEAFNIPPSVVPEFMFDIASKSFSCNTGEYIFFVKNLKNSCNF